MRGNSISSRQLQFSSTVYTKRNRNTSIQGLAQTQEGVYILCKEEACRIEAYLARSCAKRRKTCVVVFYSFLVVDRSPCCIRAVSQRIKLPLLY